MSKRLSGILRICSVVLVVCLMLGASVCAIAQSEGGGAPVMHFPDGVKIIESNAFEGDVGIIHATLPAGLTNIGERAFANCSNLERLSFLGNSVVSIAGDAFAGCNKLTIYCSPNNTYVINYANSHSINCETWSNELTLTALAKTGGIATLTWEQAEAAASYDVYELDEGNALPTLLGNTTGKQFDVSGLYAGYHSFQVVAKGGAPERSNVARCEVMPYMEVENESLAFDADGMCIINSHEDNLRVNSNADWKMSIQADWLEEERTEYYSYSYDSPTFIMDGIINLDISAERTGKLLFSCVDGNITAEVPFTQAASHKRLMCLENDVLAISSAAQRLEYIIYSNAAWQVATITDIETEAPVSWLTANSYLGNPNNDMESLEMLSFNVQANNTGKARTAIIYLNHFTGTEGWIMEVTQFASSDYVYSSVSTYYDLANGEGYKGDVRIFASGEWTAVSNDDWIKIWVDKGADGTQLAFTVDENADPNGGETAGRTGTVTLTCGTAQSTLTVVQPGRLGKVTITAPVISEETLILNPNFTLSWDAVPNAVGYEVGVYNTFSDSNGFWRYYDAGTTTCVFDTSKLLSGHSYTCTVMAIPSVTEGNNQDAGMSGFEFIFVRPVLDVYPQHLNISGWGDHYEVNVQSNGLWEASCDADWIEAYNSYNDAGDGNTLLYLESNYYSGSEEREAVITLTMGDVQELLYVTQIPMNDTPEILTDPLFAVIEAEGGSTELSLDIPSEGWSLEIDSDWISVDREELELEPSYDTQDIMITCEPNEGSDYREGIVRLVRDERVYSEFEFHIRQNGTSAYLELLENNWRERDNMVYCGTYAEFESMIVSASGEWTATVDEACRAWIDISNDTDSGENGVVIGQPFESLYIEVASNTGDGIAQTDIRKGFITLACGSERLVIEVWQNGYLGEIKFISPDATQGAMPLLSFEGGEQTFRWTYPIGSMSFYVDFYSRDDGAFKFYRTRYPMLTISEDEVNLQPGNVYTLEVYVDDWDGRAGYATLKFVYGAEHVLEVDTQEVFLWWEGGDDSYRRIVSTKPFTVSKDSDWFDLEISIADQSEWQDANNTYTIFPAGEYDLLVSATGDNETSVYKYGEVSVSNGDITRTIDICQESMIGEPDYYFERESENAIREESEYRLPLFVYDNYSFDVDIIYSGSEQGWILADDHIDYANSEDGFMIRVLENTTGANREATLRLSYYGFVVDFKVLQSGSDDYIYAERQFKDVFDALDATANTRIFGSGEWSVTSIPEWMSNDNFVSLTGEDGDMLSFDIPDNIAANPNERTYYREGDIVLTCGGMTETLTIRQLGFAGVYIGDIVTPAHTEGVYPALQFADGAETFTWICEGGELLDGYDIHITGIFNDGYDGRWFDVSPDTTSFTLEEYALPRNWARDGIYELKVRGRLDGRYPDKMAYTNWSEPVYFTCKQQRLSAFWEGGWDQHTGAIDAGFPNMTVYSSKEWAISTDQSWLKFKVDGSDDDYVTSASFTKNAVELEFCADDNQSLSQRTGRITLTSDGVATREFFITQDRQNIPEFDFQCVSYNLSRGRQDFKLPLYVHTDSFAVSVEYDVGDAGGWLHAPDELDWYSSRDGMSVSIDENNGDARHALIKLSFLDFEHTVDIYQSATDDFVRFDWQRLGEIDPEGEYMDIRVNSSGQWRVLEEQLPDWLPLSSFDQYQGNDGESMRVRIPANYDEYDISAPTDYRDGNIVVQCGGMTDFQHITQLGYAGVSIGDITAPAQMEAIWFDEDTKTIRWDCDGEIDMFIIRLRRIWADRWEETWFNTQGGECEYTLNRYGVWWNWDDEPDGGCVYELAVRGRIGDGYVDSTRFTNWTQPAYFTYQSSKFVLSNYNTWDFDRYDVHEHEGDFGTIRVFSGGDWSANTSADWLKFKVNGSAGAYSTTGSFNENNVELMLYVEDNPSLNSRAATITFTYGNGETVSVPITQRGYEMPGYDFQRRSYNLSKNAEHIELPLYVHDEGKEFEVTVEYVNGDGWIRDVPEKLGWSDYQGLPITIDENDTGAYRYAYIKLKYFEFSYMLTIIQTDTDEYVRLDWQLLGDIAPEGEYLDIRINSSGWWSVDAENLPDWLPLSCFDQYEGNNGDSLKVRIPANYDMNDLTKLSNTRGGDIIVRSGEAADSQHIVQLGYAGAWMHGITAPAPMSVLEFNNDTETFTWQCDGNIDQFELRLRRIGRDSQDDRRFFTEADESEYTLNRHNAHWDWNEPGYVYELSVRGIEGIASGGDLKYTNWAQPVYFTYKAPEFFISNYNSWDFDRDRVWPYYGEFGSLMVFSSGAWTATATSEGDWLKLRTDDMDEGYHLSGSFAKGANLLKLYADENQSVNQRMGKLTFTPAVGEPLEFTITQYGYNIPNYSFERVSFSLSSNAEDIELPMFVFDDWGEFDISVEYAEGDGGWIHTEDKLTWKDEGRGMLVSIDQNATAAPRQADIKLNYFDLEYTLTIFQSATSDFVRFDWQRLGEIDPEGEYWDIRVFSSGQWSVDEGRLPEWLPISCFDQYAGNDGESLRVRIPANYDENALSVSTGFRFGDIVVTCNGREDSQHVRQLGYAGARVNAITAPAQMEALQFENGTETFNWTSEGDVELFELRFRRISGDGVDAEMWMNAEGDASSYAFHMDEAWWDWNEPDRVYELMIRGRSGENYPNDMAYTAWSKPAYFTYKTPTLLVTRHETWQFDPNSVDVQNDGFGELRVFASSPWSVESDSSWLLFRDCDNGEAQLGTQLYNVDEHSMKLLLHANANDTGSQRSGRLAFSMDGRVYREITINQLPQE